MKYCDIATSINADFYGFHQKRVSHNFYGLILDTHRLYENTFVFQNFFKTSSNRFIKYREIHNSHIN